MNTTQEADPAQPRMTQIVIVNRLHGGAAFGVRLDNGEHMFITAKIAKMFDADVGQTFMAQYVDNIMPEKTRWFAVRLERVDDGRAQPPEETATVDEARSKVWDLIWGRGFDTTEDDCLDDIIDYMRKLGVRFAEAQD